MARPEISAPTSWRRDVVRARNFICQVAFVVLLFFPILTVNSSIANAREKVALVPDLSPGGYTLSLSIFLMPTLTLALVLFRRSLLVDRVALIKTLIFVPFLGYVLDLCFGTLFFSFDNSRATWGFRLPAFDWTAMTVRSRQLPVEEFVFYFSGVAFTLFIYLWADLVWLRRYHVCAKVAARSTRDRAWARWDWRVPGAVAVAILLAVLVKRVGPHPYHLGFPGFFSYLVVGLVLPCALVLPVTNRWINWRALNLAMLIVLLISIVWEVTLGYPYSWWNYRMDEMMGVTIKAWSNLPIEASFQWILVTFVIIVAYESLRRFHALKPVAKVEVKAESVAPLVETLKLERGRAHGRDPIPAHPDNDCRSEVAS